MKEFLAAHTLEAIGIAIAAVTAVGVFLGPQLANRQQRKHTEQNKKLRAHFEELKEEAESIISSASNLATMAYSEMIVVSEGSHGQIVYDFDEVQVSSSFEAHFCEQARRLTSLKQEIHEHNAKCEDFRQKLTEAFELKGIPVVKNDQGEHSMCIFEAALDALFTNWKELARNSNPWPDFQNISSNPVQGGHVLHPSGWGSSVVAFAKTEDEQEKCKRALAEIAEDMESQKAAAEIVGSANELIRKGKEFAEQLVGRINDIDKFWPGSRTNKFKRLEKPCADCRELW